MEKALIEFFYQFHRHQHYFLCHDILEDAWKEQPSYSKQDAIVSLILFTTASYHHRRHNYKGALKSYKKALVTICNAVETHQLPLNIEAYQQLIEEKIYQVTKQHEFIPIYLPMTSEAELIVKRFNSDYFFEPETLTDDYIIHHHKLRDRSAVNQARILAKKKKSHNKDFSD